MEEKAEDLQSTTETDYSQKAAAHVEPLLSHLNVEGTEVDPAQIRDLFIKMWEFENGENLDPVTQQLTKIALFMYVSHNILDDFNIRLDRARNMIVQALEAWMKPELEQALATERAAENPFKAFVEGQSRKVDEMYTWEHFLREEKRADEKGWDYKMRKCWFAQFFIRFGRTDYIETACAFDKIPWENRKDYVDLKLNNLFAKLGTLCQFKYTPREQS